MEQLFIQDLKTLAITAVIAWGATEALKPMMHKGERRLAAVRTLALISGAIVGAFLHPELTEGKQSATIGACLGGAAGALNAIIVAVIKKKLKSNNEEKPDGNQRG